MKTTIESIIKEMQQRVEDGIFIEPASWVETAMRICTLGDTLDNDLAEMEGMMADEENRLLEADMTSSKAKALSRKAIDYVSYLKLKARVKRIDEYIMIAKKRATIQNI